LKKFWQILDIVGEEGAPRLTWRKELGEDFPKFEGCLRPRDVVSSMLDPEVPDQILDLEEREDGNFDAVSRAIPSHRSPFVIPRHDIVRLVPDIAALADHMTTKLDDNLLVSRPSRIGNLHEIGTLNRPRQQARPVFLFLPSFRPRSLALKEGLIHIESAVLLLPTTNCMNFELRQIAVARKIEVRILDTDKELATAPALRGKNETPPRPPLITPRRGWTWKHLTLVFEEGGLRARIQGDERFASWKELGFNAFSRGKIQGPMKILTTLASGGRIPQRRTNENERQQISRARKILCELFPLEGDPFHKFKDGYGITFQVEIPIARQQSRAMKDADTDDENAVPTGRPQFNPEDIDGFSTFST